MYMGQYWQIALRVLGSGPGDYELEHVLWMKVCSKFKPVGFHLLCEPRTVGINLIRSLLNITEEMHAHTHRAKAKPSAAAKQSLQLLLCGHAAQCPALGTCELLRCYESAQACPP